MDDRRNTYTMMCRINTATGGALHDANANVGDRVPLNKQHKKQAKRLPRLIPTRD